jgi:hypothetical protein
MMNFTEKDLVRCAEDAGFPEVHVELLVDVEPGTYGGVKDRRGRPSHLRLVEPPEK